MKKYNLRKDLEANIGGVRYQGKAGDTIECDPEHVKYFSDYLKLDEGKKPSKKSKKDQPEDYS